MISRIAVLISDYHRYQKKVDKQRSKGKNYGVQTTSYSKLADSKIK
jgi:hypothetical protein